MTTTKKKAVSKKSLSASIFAEHDLFDTSIDRSTIKSMVVELALSRVVNKNDLLGEVENEIKSIMGSS